MQINRDTPVWDTPSGMGGTFTVALPGDDGISAIATARVCYGRFDESGNFVRWPDWDGYTFPVKRSELTNQRRLGDKTPKPNTKPISEHESAR